MPLLNIRPLLLAAIFAFMPPAMAGVAPIPPYDDAASDPVAAARAFLNSLSDAEKNTATLDIKAPARRVWSNLPADAIQRAGVRIGDLSGQQQALLFRFLSASLSPQGYRAAGDAIAAEAALSSDPKAGRLRWSPDNYWMAFYGQPSENKKWGWQFGGHHLALNAALEGPETVAISPTFVGAEPAQFTLEGQQFQPLRQMHLTGTAAYNALNEEQQSDARLFLMPGDLVAGPGEDGNVPSPKGSPVKDWSDQQRELLIRTMREWVALQPGKHAEERMQELTAQLDETHFAWHGPADGSDENYFRIQGPSVIIELLWQRGVGSASNGHYHSIYRDPTNEYGMQLK